MVEDSTCRSPFVKAYLMLYLATSKLVKSDAEKLLLLRTATSSGYQQMTYH